jgi:hypothetical protein
MAGLTANLEPFMQYRCAGPHRFFVAHVVREGGYVYVLGLCTDCGDGIQRAFQVAPEESK